MVKGGLRRALPAGGFDAKARRLEIETDFARGPLSVPRLRQGRLRGARHVHADLGPAGGQLLRTLRDCHGRSPRMNCRLRNKENLRCGGPCSR